MKLAESSNPKRPRGSVADRRKGVALVTVLTVMALTTILVLTFFSLATSEHRSSYTYSQGLHAQQVAEQAVNMVIAQIREATTTTSPGNISAWASQPGAIRVWNENGTPQNAFKLYSDDVMRTSDWNDFQTDFQDARNWSSRPEQFVDLNEPVIRGERAYFPIVHPAAAVLPRWPRPIGGRSAGIEGFRFNEDGLVLNDEGPIGARAARLAQANGHVAMPVRWLYQLADGTLGVLDDSSGGGGATGPSFAFRPISGAGIPSARNPMVARFAFWADDETTKLNINTHAGGLAWDIPKAGGELDMAMGKFQPAQKEWQRYPGHPATTHLIPALAPGVLDIVNDRDAMEMLFLVVPRIVGGGSESGTRIINTRDPREMNGLVPDNEPLFPSLDDLVMRADRTPHQFPDATGRPIPPDQLSEHLERAKFFITVNSRAPETNLFNRPRIAMWPVHNADPSNTQAYNQFLTAFDQLIHFCSSMGRNTGGGYPRFEYIFKRERADSGIHDFANIPRNQQLYNYLTNMLDRNIPGYGRSFASKYGRPSTDQLATMIFDYIRSTNLHDDTLFEDFMLAFQRENRNQFLTYTNPRDFDEKGFGHKGHGQVTPIRIGQTKGMGRFFTLSGADIHMICAGMHASEPTSSPLYPGVTQHNRGIVEQPEGLLFSNLPPLPPGVNGPGDQNKANWPQWLRDLEDAGGGPEFLAAFDEAQWNWQLAFLDPTYRAAVLANPTQNKFNRGLITPPGSDLMRLRPGERLVQASFLFQLFCPSIGWGSINPDMEIHIQRQSGMTFSGAEETVGFLGFEGLGSPTNPPNTYIWATNWAKPHRQGGARSWGGLLSFGYTLSARQPLQEGNAQVNRRNVWWQMANANLTLSGNIRSRLTPLDRGYNAIEQGLSSVSNRRIGGTPANIAQAYRYDLVTVPFRINATDGAVFDGGTVKFDIYSGGQFTEGSARRGGPELVQEITMDFPAFRLPGAPLLDPAGDMGHINEFTQLSQDSQNAVELGSVTADPGNPLSTPRTKATRRNGIGRSAAQIALANRGRMAFVVSHWDKRDSYIRLGDVVQSICVPHGDVRIPASMPVIVPNDGVYAPHRRYGTVPMAHSLTNSVGVGIAGFNPAADRDFLIIPDLPSNAPPYRDAIPMPFGTELSRNVQLYGDFDNGAGTMIDGPYINKPDEGNVHSLRTRFTQEIVDYWEQRRNYGDFPYFSNPELAEAGGPAYFSPNRIVSGPGMLGSLPTSLASRPPMPWQTLLFRPNVVGNGYTSHPGAGATQGGQDPPDHLIMDLFWMPVVEPYAISEPLSTAGKINMNFQTVPFLHIHRDTALRGVFRSELILCIPNQWHRSYKHGRGRGQGYHWRDNPFGGELQGKRLRAHIVEDPTLAQFLDRFQNGRNAFKSASEICEIHLVPEEAAVRLGRGGRGSIGTYTPTVQQMANGSYWRDHSLVGDNSRERPYTNIHTRLTTKSNTFTVHYRAQVIKQGRRQSDAEYREWRPFTDSVQAEYRGSSIVERFVDPNDDMPDFTQDNAPPLDEFYRFRVINPRRFAP